MVRGTQEPVLLGGYAAKQCPVRVQNDFLPLVPTLKWVPSPEDQARLDAGIAFERNVFEDLAAFTRPRLWWTRSWARPMRSR